MSLYRQFELHFLAAVVMFMGGGLVGLAALWIGLAILPVAIPAVDPIDALAIYSLEVLAIFGAIALAVVAHGNAVRAWRTLAGALHAQRVNVEFIDKWMTGSGLLMAWSALLVPFFAAAMLAISPWLATIVAGLVYAAVRGLAGASGVRLMYREVRTKFGAVTGPPVNVAAWPAVLAAAVALFALVALYPEIEGARAHVAAATSRNLDVVKAAIEERTAALPELKKLLADRVALEEASLAAEERRLADGYASPAQVSAARGRLLEAQSTRIARTEETLKALDDLRRQQVELETRLRAHHSAAPALVR